MLIAPLCIVFVLVVLAVIGAYRVGYRDGGADATLEEINR